MKNPEEEEALDAVRRALGRLFVHYLPWCEGNNAENEKLVTALGAGDAELLFEVRLCAGGLKLTCSIDEPRSGERGFMFEAHDTARGSCSRFVGKVVGKYKTPRRALGKP